MELRSSGAPYVLDPEILAYYAEGREDGRLRQGIGRLELWRTRDVLRRVLPRPHGGERLLDVGGGSGVHAEWLADDGWAVELIDPVPSHVERAAALPGVSARLGDARALDCGDQCADVVLLLGPLYHLIEPAERHRALSEAGRVVRRGGFVVVATINRYAGLLDHLSRGTWFEPVRRSRIEATCATGRVRTGGEFTTAYFHHPADIAAEVAKAGLMVTGQYGVEGAAWLMAGTAAALDDDERRDALLVALRIPETDPTMLGVSAHLLTVARRAE
jgi:SAM-dependent methyltransferase